MRPLIQPTRALFLFSPPHGPSLPLPTRVCSDSLAQLVLVPEKGIPLRGHDEGVDSTNQGNLRELVKPCSEDNKVIQRFMIN
ncbi:hypothetical protein Y1Q_0012469 [Alligator mississippiensis]|uniref:Uncharacterized protein n=1 Tax=Alligator mississippiensis TaxID=8496 RepID=A0A151M7Q9_ALLMI|nr:hypothetical protein Y1Q_0012469 [Alligator mississippiensis]